MSSLQLTNEKFILGRTSRGLLLACYLFMSVWLSSFSNSTQGTIGIFLICACALAMVIYTYKRGVVRFTITDTHLQQHTFKGGWVVKWQNVSSLGLCRSHQPTQSSELPWIGIRLKDPVPFVKQACPRLITNLLLEQRPLLYLGARETEKEHLFQDQVLDSSRVELKDGETIKGLQACLYHRMHYQREYWGYDIFISTADLDRDGEEFVGLLRKYLAGSGRST
ncbi:DUF2982 domain-containing protein [Vibrio breoganii]|uniref:DUF2982 domain-containing protein n=1 Tax=Vibrio breoganii TaxID=553239 RepID=UPI0021C3C4A0|nr:DUF2982 domain-containing protein [Vibrio breoganii]MDN3714858.1 DUF2982 domain-containing protein [Vibrio breoganii]